MGERTYLKFKGKQSGSECAIELSEIRDEKLRRKKFLKLCGIEIFKAKCVLMTDGHGHEACVCGSSSFTWPG